MTQIFFDFCDKAAINSRFHRFLLRADKSVKSVVVVIRIQNNNAQPNLWNLRNLW